MTENQVIRTVAEIISLTDLAGRNRLVEIILSDSLENFNFYVAGMVYQKPEILRCWTPEKNKKRVEYLLDNLKYYLEENK